MSHKNNYFFWNFTLSKILIYLWNAFSKCVSISCMCIEKRATRGLFMIFFRVRSPSNIQATSVFSHSRSYSHISSASNRHVYVRQFNVASEISNTDVSNLQSFPVTNDVLWMWSSYVAYKFCWKRRRIDVLRHPCVKLIDIIEKDWTRRWLVYLYPFLPIAIS